MAAFNGFYSHFTYSNFGYNYLGYEKMQIRLREETIVEVFLIKQSRRASLLLF